MNRLDCKLVIKMVDNVNWSGILNYLGEVKKEVKGTLFEVKQEADIMFGVRNYIIEEENSE